MNIYKGPKYSGPDTLTGGGVSTTPLAVMNYILLNYHCPFRALVHPSSCLMTLSLSKPYILLAGSTARYTDSIITDITA